MAESASADVFGLLKLELAEHYARARWYAKHGDRERAIDELSRAILSLCRAREALRTGG
jgi:hypothetical protein